MRRHTWQGPAMAQEATSSPSLSQSRSCCTSWVLFLGLRTGHEIETVCYYTWGNADTCDFHLSGPFFFLNRLATFANVQHPCHTRKMVMKLVVGLLKSSCLLVLQDDVHLFYLQVLWNSDNTNSYTVRVRGSVRRDERDFLQVSPTSKHLLRRYLGPRNIPKTSCQEVCGCLGYGSFRTQFFFVFAHFLHCRTFLQDL